MIHKYPKVPTTHEGSSLLIRFPLQSPRTLSSIMLLSSSMAGFASQIMAFAA
jgi:hypothetical protein